MRTVSVEDVKKIGRAHTLLHTIRLNLPEDSQWKWWVTECINMQSILLNKFAPDFPELGIVPQEIEHNPIEELPATRDVAKGRTRKSKVA